MSSKWQMLRNALILSSGAPYPWGAGVFNGYKLYLVVSYHLYFIPGGRGLTFWHAIELDRGYQQKPPFNVYVHSTSGTLVSPSSSYDWRQVPSTLICMNVASLLFERGCQFPISISALVIKTGGVGVGGVSVGGTVVGVGGISVGGTGVGVGGISVEGTGVGVGGISVDGKGAAAGALHPTRNKRTTVIFINTSDNFW